MSTHTAVTLSKVPEFLRDFPSESNKALAERFGCSVSVVEQAAYRAGVRKTRAQRSVAGLAGVGLTAYTENRLQIKALAHQYRRGVSQSEVVSALRLPSRRVGRTLQRLTENGELVRVEITGRELRWFAREAWAEEYRAFMAADGQLEEVAVAADPIKPRRGRPPHDPDARQVVPTAAPSWVCVGRNAPRVGSVFDLAAGVTR